MRGRSSQNIWILVLLMLAGVVLGAAGAAAAGAAGCAGLLPVSTPLGHLFAQMPQALHFV